MSLLAYIGTPLIRHRKAAYAAPPVSGVFASENWEGRADGSSPDNTPFQVGAGEWYSNFSTVVSGDNPISGTRSLKFPFEGYAEEVVELWYNLNGQYPDLWIKYDIRIPDNYTIVDGTPGSALALGGGDKEWVVFSDGYSTNYPTLILGRYFQRRTEDGGTLISPPTKVFQLGNISATDQSGVREYEALPNDSAAYEKECLFDITVDLGTVQTRYLHIKMPTTATSNDGVVELWNKKANGITYKIVSLQTGAFYGDNPNSTGGNYMTGGYMLGSLGTSGGFDEATDFLVDNIEFSTNNQWGLS